MAAVANKRILFSQILTLVIGSMLPMVTSTTSLSQRSLQMPTHGHEDIASLKEANWHTLE